MTCNQLIVLLDVYRGFRSEVHLASLATDIQYLRKKYLIDKQELRLTDNGHCLVKLLLEVASLAH